MTEEIANKIKSLTWGLNELKRQVTERECELNDLYLESAGDLVGSYVELNNCYMKVEKQYTEGGLLVLKGPVLGLDVDPLDEEKEEIDQVLFRNEDEFLLTSEMVRGIGPTLVNKLTEDEMRKVLEAVNGGLASFFGL